MEIDHFSRLLTGGYLKWIRECLHILPESFTQFLLSSLSGPLFTLVCFLNHKANCKLYLTEILRNKSRRDT